MLARGSSKRLGIYWPGPESILETDCMVQAELMEDSGVEVSESFQTVD